jgi:hypothetical protein
MAKIICEECGSEFRTEELVELCPECQDKRDQVDRINQYIDATACCEAVQFIIEQGLGWDFVDSLEAEAEGGSAMKQLLGEYLWATEVNLATLEELCFLKSSSRVRIRRQRVICERMLKVCQEYSSELDAGQLRSSTRTSRALSCGAVLMNGVAVWLDREIERWLAMK